MKRDNPPSHYLIPGMDDIELIDILRAKSTIAKDPWQFFLWASAMQYLWRYDVKGEPIKDLGKANTYLSWLRDEVNGGRGDILWVKK